MGFGQRLGRSRPSDDGDLGAVAGPSWSITSPALLDSIARVQMLVAGRPSCPSRHGKEQHGQGNGCQSKPHG